MTLCFRSGFAGLLLIGCGSQAKPQWEPSSVGIESLTGRFDAVVDPYCLKKFILGDEPIPPASQVVFVLDHPRAGMATKVKVSRNRVLKCDDGTTSVEDFQTTSIVEDKMSIQEFANRYRKKQCSYLDSNPSGPDSIVLGRDVMLLKNFSGYLRHLDAGSRDLETTLFRLKSGKITLAKRYSRPHGMD